MIDPHVHFRDWGQRDEETVLHGLRMAAKAGFHQVFDMPNTAPAITGRTMTLKRMELGRGASRLVSEETGRKISYRFYVGIAADPAQIAMACSLWREFFPSVAGLKMFASQSTGDMGICACDDQRMVYRELARNGYRGVLAVHCEKQSLFTELPGMSYQAVPERDFPGASRDAVHSLRRPPESETESIKDQIAFAGEQGFKGSLHVCHISTGESIDVVKSAKAGGFSITCGATGHHCLYSMNRPEYLKMNPPLRPEDDRKAVLQGLSDGSVDWLESDHAPHSRAQIEAGAFGIPGFGNSLRVLALLKGKIPAERLEEISGRRVAEAFGLEYGYDDGLEWVLGQDMEAIARSIESEYPLD